MITATLNSHDHKKKNFFSCNYGIIVRSVCVFSLHFRAQAWNFVKSFIRMQKVKFGSDTKVLLLDDRPDDRYHRAKKKFFQISLSYSSLDRSCSADKSLQKHNTFIFCFSKVIEVYKLLKSGGSQRKCKY